MVEREKLSDLALRNRRVGLTRVLPPLGEALRGSLIVSAAERLHRTGRFEGAPVAGF